VGDVFAGDAWIKYYYHGISTHDRKMTSFRQSKDVIAL